MRTSTKIFIVLSILTLVPNIFLTKFLLLAIIPTVNGFVFDFSALSWVALAFQILFMVFSGILFFRFLKVLRLSNVIFFSTLPLTLVYSVAIIYLSSIKQMDDVTSVSVRATLNISKDQASYNNLLWIGLLTIVYLVLVFVIAYLACKPLSKVEKVAQKLGDGRLKKDNFKLGGGKQFKEIENSLNKINYNIKEKENKLKIVDLEKEKSLSKEFSRFLGKNSLEQLELGNQIKKDATTLFCELKNSSNTSKTISLEENFNYINSYLKIVSPLIKRYDGFVDKYLGDGLLAVFAKPQDAILCGQAILKAIDVKNKSQKELPSVNACISINTGEVVFGILGDESKKTPTIISDALSLSKKMEEINTYIGTKMLISKTSLNTLPHNFEFDHRYMGSVSLENKLQMPLFECLSYYPKSKREKLKKLKNKFESGVRAYNEQKYEKAKELFEYVLHYVSDDKPSFVYFNKCTEKMKDVA